MPESETNYLQESFVQSDAHHMLMTFGITSLAHYLLRRLFDDDEGKCHAVRVEWNVMVAY